ncbi:matrix-remodeling-associated protein 7 isoform X2 [Nycticebus coucang]|uniref:matrix-remodeling-associated protein 7 isoform X2 n=1 Tax=Nycticebus coucang TaxID=9470 RepID=UPI00234E32D1|nr:matrix-remodeling-associated protein 7 isoform X2 [Nycticebus coucang]
MEAPAELLAALPALATVLALLIAWLLVRRGATTASLGPSRAPPEPAPPAEASRAPAPPSPCAPEPAAAPAGPGEPEEPAEPGEPEGPGEPTAAPVEAEERAAEARQEEEEDSDTEKGPPQAEPEEENGETFFKYSPGKLRGNQYKKMMTKEELEEEQRIELTSDLTSL